MDLKSISVEQRNALIDLLVLGMYSDGHLARVEDARIEKILHAMGYAAKFDRDRELDAAVTRVRQYSESSEKIRAHAQTLATAFSSRTDRQQALKSLEDVLTSDHEVSSAESRFLDVVRQAFD